MEIINEYPPNYKSILNAFPSIKDEKGALFCYGRAIYNPGGAEINECLMHHEATHSIRQDKIGPSKWWRRYIRDARFRLEEEIVAYRNQYQLYCKLVTSEDKRFNYLHDLAMTCSSPIYGNMISYEEGKILIKQ